VKFSERCNLCVQRSSYTPLPPGPHEFGMHVTSQICASKAFKNTFSEGHLLLV